MGGSPLGPEPSPELVIASSKRVYIETYGCQMNVADSELMFGVLGREGYVRADHPAEADVMLVNTCAVRDNAEQRVIGRMGELQRHKRPGDVLGVVGCMAQRLGPVLLERVPKVDLVVGPDAYRNLPELIDRAGQRPARHRRRVSRWEHYEDVPPVREKSLTALVTVQRGCDYRCTFCIVPFTRGPERSRRLEDVVREVEALAAGGTTEVTLLGQTVNSYHDGQHDFADLLRAVGAVDGIRRLRFTSPYPTEFTERVIEAMASTPAVCEHVHLPVQSGSDAVLRRMLRRYTRERYLEFVARAPRPPFPASRSRPTSSSASPARPRRSSRRRSPSSPMRISTTPTPSSSRSARARRRCACATMSPDDVASARLERLIEAVRANTRRKNVARVGEVHEVLVERPARRGDLMLGRTRTNQLVLLDLPPSAAGDYHTCRLTGTTGSTFTGAVVMPALAVL